MPLNSSLISLLLVLHQISVAFSRRVAGERALPLRETGTPALMPISMYLGEKWGGRFWGPRHKEGRRCEDVEGKR